MPGGWRITDEVTVTPLVLMRFEGGAVLRLEGAANVIMDGLFEAPLDQIFNLQGSGRVKLETREIRDIFPQWWGAKGNGSDDDTNAIQYALDAATVEPFGNSNHYRTVVLPENSYLVTGTLRILCDLQGQTNPLSGETATLVYQGPANSACLRNEHPYLNGMTIRNIQIDMTRNNENDVTGIHCLNGQVQGVFENVLIQCKKDREVTVKQYGIYIQGIVPSGQIAKGYNCTGNQFNNVTVEDADVGIWIGDYDQTLNVSDLINQDAQGGSNVLVGGVILGARMAGILLTGGQNAIIGGDHSALNTGNVIFFGGGFDSQGNALPAGWCQNNSIVGTTMDIFNGNASNHAIRIFTDESPQPSGISHVFTATSLRASSAINFVTDNVVSQRWVAVRNNGAVEAREFFARGINALGNGDPYNVSLTGGGPTGELTSDKAFAIKGSAELTPGMILLGTSNAPASFEQGLPVLSNGVTLLMGPTSRIYFARLISDSAAAELGRIDSAGNLTLRGAFRMSEPDSGGLWKAGSDPTGTAAGVRGDIVWNNGPTAGGKIGWVCVATGGPGVAIWKTFGFIDS